MRQLESSAILFRFLWVYAPYWFQDILGLEALLLTLTGVHWEEQARFADVSARIAVTQDALGMDFSGRGQGVWQDWAQRVLLGQVAVPAVWLFVVERIHREVVLLRTPISRRCDNDSGHQLTGSCILSSCLRVRSCGEQGNNVRGWMEDEEEGRRRRRE